MSYSIGVRGKTKLAALAALAIKFDETVVATQPSHQADRDQALAAAAAMAGVLPDDESKEVNIYLSGSLSWSGVYPESHTFSAASVNASVSLVAPDPEQAT